ncbi:MAG: SDR family NAD(P)-dependent oxidoreductase [Dorea sp.]|jgi:NADP-dependent 3-hydroxy acid dehydrogenase YdfG|nr:SDR family NAD(P)-dependent oxidoreductase [Dorea sp.]
MGMIKDKVIVILGASSGIGETTVRLLAKKGAKLIIVSRREKKLKELADSLTGYTVAYKAADVASYEEVKAVIDMAMELYGRVDVLYNNAGIMSTASLIEGRRNDVKAGINKIRRSNGHSCLCFAVLGLVCIISRKIKINRLGILPYKREWHLCTER